MTPSTRLHEQLGGRAMYSSAAQARAGGRHNPIVISDESATPPSTPYRRTSGPRIPPTISSTIIPRTRDTWSHFIAEFPLTMQGNRVTKKTTVKAKKKEPERKECVICVETKTVKRGFTELNTEGCAHFRDICNRCVSKMIKTKISERRLDEAVLACPFPRCECVLQYANIKEILSEAQFAVWDRALTTHLLRSSDAFIACLDPACGQYFSKESCKANRANNKHEIQCPYCEYALCLNCVRPWHPKTSCSKEKSAENKKSEATIKRMGAKPCPKCGVNIEKNGGCDHMTCRRCRHHFCFECLVEYKTNMTHLPSCCGGRRGIAIDPQNWVRDLNFGLNNVAQLVNAVRGVVGLPPPDPAPFALQQPDPNQNHGFALEEPAAQAPVDLNFGRGLRWFTPRGQPGAQNENGR